MNPGIDGDGRKGDPGIASSEGSEEAIGVPSVSPQDPMFDVVQGKAMAADFVDEAVKKPEKLLDGALKAKLDHSMNHHGIVDIDPESEELRLALE
jgi:hypothetical protein